MFLLFLIGLGTVGVKAQVRIGGNATPNASAVLDLNADDTNSGNKGLALPRVALTSNQMLLPGVTQNLSGMLVYNTSTTGTGVNTIGIYYWNGANWIKSSLPSTSAADSGKYLMSNGTAWVAVAPNRLYQQNLPDTLIYKPVPPLTAFSLAIDTTFAVKITVPTGWYGQLSIPALQPTDLCLAFNSNNWELTAFPSPAGSRLSLVSVTGIPITAGTNIHLRCYRPFTSLSGIVTGSMIASNTITSTNISPGAVNQSSTSFTSYTMTVSGLGSTVGDQTSANITGACAGRWPWVDSQDYSALATLSTTGLAVYLTRVSPVGGGTYQVRIRCFTN